MMNDYQHARTVGMEYGIGISWNPIDGIVMEQRSWIGPDDVPICLKNNGIGQEVARPEVVYMLLLHICDDRIIVGRINCTIVGLKG